MSPDGHARDAEARADLVVGDEDAVAVGDLDAPAPVAVGRRHLGDGVPAGACRLVGLDEELDLAGLGDVLGELATSFLVTRRRCSSATTRAAPALAGDGGGGLGGGEQTAFGQVGGVGVARRLPHDHPDAAPAVAARRELLDPAVVEHGGGGLAVLDEHLGELSAALERAAEHTLDDRGLDE